MPMSSSVATRVPTDNPDNEFSATEKLYGVPVKMGSLSLMSEMVRVAVTVAVRGVLPLSLTCTRVFFVVVFLPFFFFFFKGNHSLLFPSYRDARS